MKKHFFICILFLIMLIIPNVSSYVPENKNIIKKSTSIENLELNDKMYYKQGLQFVHISASSDYEYGYKEGLHFFKYYNRLINFANRWFSKSLDYIKPYALSHSETLNKYYPSYLERLRGKADVLSINLLDLLSIDLFYLGFHLHNCGCTNTASSDKATIDDQAYLSWNVDINYFFKLFFSKYFQPPPVIICDIAGKNKYVKFSVLPSIFSFGLINEHGISYAGSTVPANDQCYEGLTSLELNNLAMETCTDVDEVAELYNTTLRSTGVRNLYTLFGLTANLNTIWADGNGDIMVIEYNHSSIITKKDVVLAETNHYQFLNVTYEIKNNTRERLKRAYELLNGNLGNIEINFYKNVLTSDHEKGLKEGKPDKYDICRHDLIFGTVCVIIMQPKKLGGYYCPGHPCRVGFKYLDFSEELKEK